MPAPCLGGEEMPEKKGHHHEEDEEDDDDDDKKEEVVIVVVVVEEGEEEVESIVPRPSLRTVPRFSSHHISYRCIVRYLLSLSLSLSLSHFPSLSFSASLKPSQTHRPVLRCAPLLNAPHIAYAFRAYPLYYVFAHYNGREGEREGERETYMVWKKGEGDKDETRDGDGTKRNTCKGGGNRRERRRATG